MRVLALGCTSLLPGDTVAVVYDTFNHYAIVSDRKTDGMPNLIALSQRRGTVQEEIWQRGTQGATVRKSHIGGALPAQEVLDKARSLIGKPTYKLFTNNCEHFVRWAHGLPVESKQVAGGVTGAALLGLAGSELTGGHKGWTLGMALLGCFLGVAAANKGS